MDRVLCALLLLVALQLSVVCAVAVSSCSECHSNATCTGGGSPTCDCKVGFTGNGTDCEDINECDTGACDYSRKREECRNTEGSYECYCPGGRIRDGINPQGSCLDVDECALKQGQIRRPCEKLDDSSTAIGTCRNTDGNYECICNAGYEELIDPAAPWTGYEESGVPSSADEMYIRECVDYNECNKPLIPSRCDDPSRATCNDFVGFHNCSCNPGWKAKNGTTEGEDCENENECTSVDQPHDCDVNATCADNSGSYACTCDGGFTGNGFNCTDILECDDPALNDCDGNATCAEEEGSYSCNCNTGYSGNGTSCANLLECNDPALNDCHQNASCADTAGSYTCTCNDGFTGNGTHCDNFDECSISSSDPDYHQCDVNANCTDDHGSYSCVCNTGYRGDGFNCTEIDECTDPTDQHDCHSNASCANDNSGSYTCTCNTGYTGDGFSCADINECNTTNDCSSDSNCTNTDGSYICTCNVGYTGDALTSGSGCSDIHECNDNTDDCHDNATCSNTVGSHTCTCNPGFAGDGYDCRDILIYAGTTASSNSHQMQEESIGMTSYPQNIASTTTILSVISGGTPGTIIQNAPINDTMMPPEIGVAFYTSYESSVMPKYDWLGVDPYAFNSSEFQYGSVPIRYQVFEKCVDVNFTETMTKTPSVVVSLYATHSLDPFILDYSLVWTEGVTASGFRACVHEAVLFSGEHEATISYVAVSTNTTVYGAITEHQIVNFDNGTVAHANETYLEPFCHKVFFEHRYTAAPAVFVTAENEMGSKGEQNAWIKKVTERYVYVCTKNSIDDPGHRQVAANVSMLVAGRQPFHICSGVVPPNNLDCFANETDPTSYYFDCWRDCDEDVRFENVCSSDFGYYHSECHMMKETCEMYGKDVVGNVTVTTERASGCTHNVSAYSAFQLTSLTETDVENTYCATPLYTEVLDGEELSDRFHNYSDVLIATSFFTNISDGSSSVIMNGVSTWVQDVNNTHFTACVSIIGGYAQASNVIKVVIYQKNLHTRIREGFYTPKTMQGGTMKLPNWKRGSQCVNVMEQMKMDVENGTAFSLTIDHGDRSRNPNPVSAISVWRESAVNNASIFRFCARTVDMFSVPQSGVSINWIAVQDFVTDDQNAKFNIPPFTFTNDAAHDADEARFLAATTVTNDTTLFPSNTTILDFDMFVTVNNLVDQSVIDNSEKRSGISFSTWVHYDDTNTAGVCYQASWPGRAFGESKIRPLSFYRRYTGGEGGEGGEVP